MNLALKREAIRGLLDERSPADAAAAYYAFYHPDQRTELFTIPDRPPLRGYLAISQTGIDLFRPLITLRLPEDDLAAATGLFYQALAPGAHILLSGPARYAPFLRAHMQIELEQRLQIHILDPARFQPVVNVLVTRSISQNGLPRFTIAHSPDGGKDKKIVASAGLNWQSPHFAEIAVHTRPRYRRRGWGRSVVSALAQHLLNEGRMPLYIVAEENEASRQIAQQLGFMNTGERELFLQGVVKPQP